MDQSSERQQQRKSKSFHIDDRNFTNEDEKRRRHDIMEHRRSSLGKERERRRDRSLERRSLERPNEEPTSMEQQHVARRTVIHACDDRTGKCLFHPWIVLRKKAIFGVLGGWVDVLRSCPECEEEDLHRLNGGTAGHTDTERHTNVNNTGYPDHHDNGNVGRSMPTRRRRRTISPRNRERTVSPTSNRRVGGSWRDRTLSPLDRRKHLDFPTKRRDRTLSPPKRENSISPIHPQSNDRKKSYKYAPPPVVRHVPRQRSRTLSPIDRTRKKLQHFEKKNYYYNQDDDIYEERRRRHDWRRTTEEYNHSNVPSDEIKKKYKKKVKSRDYDYISAYLATGSVPHETTKRRGSYGVVREPTVHDWKNLSDVMIRGSKLAAEKWRKKKKKDKVQQHTPMYSNDQPKSESEKLDKYNLIYDVDIDEQDGSFHDDILRHSKSNDEKSSRRNKKTDLSDRTGETEHIDSYTTINQSPARKRDGQVENTYEKSYSDDGIRVHAMESLDDYDQCNQASSIDAGIRVVGEDVDTARNDSYDDESVTHSSFPGAASQANNSRNVHSSDTFNMDTLQSVVNQYNDTRPSVHDITDNSSAPNGANNENVDEKKENVEHQHDDEPAPISPFPSKQEALPRVMSLGNLTIDLSTLQATRLTKPDNQTEVKPVVKHCGNGTTHDSSSDSEEINIDRSTLQRARPKRDPDEETGRTFATSNLPWTGRFGETGMYTGYVNEQYQPHGKGTMLFDHGEVKEGHWKDGDFLREIGPYSESENDDDDEDDEDDLSSSMIDLNDKAYRSRAKDHVDHQAPLPPPLPAYHIGDIAKHDDMIHDADIIQKYVPKLDVEDTAFIRRSDGKWTYAIVKLLENNDGNRAIRFTVNDKNSSKSYAEKYWFSHIRPTKDTAKCAEDNMPKRCDPAGIISRQSSDRSINNTEKEEGNTNRGAYCPPVRLFGPRGRSRSRSRRRGASLTPMRTLCSIDESDMEDESDDENDDSIGRVEVTGLHALARTAYALRGIDP